MLLYNALVNKNGRIKTMLDRIRYYLLLRELRAEIAETVKKSTQAPAAKGMYVQTGVKTACKACGSIV